MANRYSKLKPTWHYLWQFGFLSGLCILGISILETWPSKICSFPYGTLCDKHYVHALSNGFSGTIEDYLIEQIINVTVENIVIVLIMLALVCGLVGFISDTFSILNFLNKGLLKIINKIRDSSWLFRFE